MLPSQSDKLSAKFPQLNGVESTTLSYNGVSIPHSLTAYIPTGYFPDENMGIEMVYMTKDPHSPDVGGDNSCGVICGGRSASMVNNFEVSSHTNWQSDLTKGGIFRFGNMVWRLMDYPNNTKRFFRIKNKVATVDSGNTVDLSKATWNGTSTGELILFGLSHNTSSPNYGGNSIIYYCKIWDGDTLIRDFIPTLDADGYPAFWCNVTQKFYSNPNNTKNPLLIV